MRAILASRAALSLGIGVWITFDQYFRVHNATFGLLALAVFGLGFALLNGVTTSIWGRGLVAIENMPLTVVAFLVGLLAALVPSASGQITPEASFLAMVTIWGIISGAFELYLARRAGFRSTEGRDSLINACMGLALGVLFLLAQPDIVSAVGFFGAYLVMTGVHLGIAAASPVKQQA